MIICEGGVSLGIDIREKRTEQGLTQRELGAKVEPEPMSQSGIYAVEIGKTHNLDTIERIYEALGYDLCLIPQKQRTL